MRTELWFLLALLSGIAHSWSTAVDEYRCLGRAGWDGGKEELPFAVRAVGLPAALPGEE